MRYQVAVVTTATLLVAVVTAGLFARTQSAAGEPVTISAVAVDREGLPVRNLTAADFRVTENGKPVSVTSFGVATIGEATERGRSVALVLGAGGLDPELTTHVQSVARGFIDKGGANDRVSVIRSAYLRKDEVAGSRQDMLMRVAEYRAPMGEPVNARTPRDVLDLVAKLSKELTTVEASRRAIIFIGSPSIYDIVEPELREHELEWPNWVSALKAAADANVSVYVIDPAGLQGHVRINPDGLVAQTGGTVFYNRNDLTRAVDLAWGETSSYYALEYAGLASRAPLQKINVAVSKPGVTIRARRSR